VSDARTTEISGYSYSHSHLGDVHGYLLPLLGRELARHGPPPRRIFDLGCGNGSVAKWLTEAGYRVSGVDPSDSGIREANRAHPDLDLRQGSAYDDLAATFGTFPAVVSLEVIEHVYAPREFVKCIRNLLEPGGCAFVSTPYHGYLKNVALALAGKFDDHFTALWDNGHIKFWSPRTITTLFREAGFRVEHVWRVGRLPVFAKSMVVMVRKPG
jgi:2-polyprenyl-3-methyl-5-hydroxy-6-metoxy-1,4-benzoquinol methylase